MVKGLSEVEVIHKELKRWSTNYYRNRFRSGVKFLLLLVLLSIILGSGLAYLYITSPHFTDKFYASNVQTGQVTSVYSLSSPVIKPAKLLQWTQDTIISAFTFNFANYNDVFNSVKKSFTDNGWNEFNDFLNNSKLLDQVTKKELFVSAVAAQKPTIISEGDIKGRYAWNISLPIMVSYSTRDSADQQPQTQPFNVSVVVTRVPDIDNPDEVAITHFSVS
jgi:intracellular multiplication protein IcmL